MVYEEEWRNLSIFFSVDQEISVERNRPKPLTNGSAETNPESLDVDNDYDDWKFSPAVCKECLERRHLQELEEQLVSLKRNDFNSDENKFFISIGLFWLESWNKLSSLSFNLSVVVWGLEER